MKSPAALLAISELVDSAIEVTAALQATTDEEWEAIIDNPLVDALISACGEVEYCVS
jgi:hypothetical protein